MALVSPSGYATSIQQSVSDHFLYHSAWLNHFLPGIEAHSQHQQKLWVERTKEDARDKKCQVSISRQKEAVHSAPQGTLQYLKWNKGFLELEWW